ncbi:MAG: M16 family metallopeptidase [Myxococcota bacterium]
MTGTTIRMGLLAALVSLLGACGPKGATEGTTPATGAQDGADPTRAEAEREPPPDPGEPKDISFPPIVRTKTDQGLEIDTVPWDKLPVVHVQLVIESGGETDPEDLPGLSHLVAAMLKEGTKKRTSAELAEQVEFLGADLSTSSDEENVYISMRALRDHLDETLDILADVAMNPTFRNDELRKLKKRELDRLALESKQPGWLARRAFHAELYGDHPYAIVDTTPEAVEKVKRADLIRWHRKFVAPNNAFLVVTGDVTADEVQASAGEAFAKWRSRDVPEPEYAKPPTRDGRQIILVDRPESVQSILYLGNLAIPRAHEDWVPLKVANQVLGGSAASRLFMDLRERRSLTYGAYSSVDGRVRTAPFRASASVRNEVTGQAMEAFFEHLDRVATTAPPESELANARTYLSDSFPLQIDTPGKIADLVADLRIYELPDDYWENYPDRIREVTSEEALEAAKAHVRPDEALVVVVGRAADVLEPLRQFGPVRVVDGKGKVVSEFERVAKDAEASEDGGSAAPTPQK